jgi:hypothetical protein
VSAGEKERERSEKENRKARTVHAQDYRGLGATAEKAWAFEE